MKLCQSQIEDSDRCSSYNSTGLRPPLKMLVLKFLDSPAQCENIMYMELLPRVHSMQPMQNIRGRLSPPQCIGMNGDFYASGIGIELLLLLLVKKGLLFNQWSMQILLKMQHFLPSQIVSWLHQAIKTIYEKLAESIYIKRPSTQGRF